MGYKNEKRGTGVVNTASIMRKVSDENFEELISEIKEFSTEERVDFGQDIFSQLIENFQYIWDEDEQAFLEPLMLFIKFATPLACAGLSEVSEKKIEQVAAYFQEFEALENLIKDNECLFDCDELTDAGVSSLIRMFLSASLEPLISPYPNLIYSYMACVACADSVNEIGLNAIKNLRNKYIEYVDKKNAGLEDEFEVSKEDIFAEIPPMEEEIGGNLDFRCFVKFRNPEIWEKVLGELSCEDTDGEEYGFLELAEVFANPRKMMDMMGEPIVDVFEGVTSSKEKAFYFIHDHRKSAKYFSGLVSYIADALAKYAQDDAVMVADMVNLNNDYGNRVFAYLGGRTDAVKVYEIEDSEGWNMHFETEIYDYKTILGDYYNELNDEEKAKIEEFSVEIDGCMNGFEFMNFDDDEDYNDDEDFDDEFDFSGDEIEDIFDAILKKIGEDDILQEEESDDEEGNE